MRAEVLRRQRTDLACAYHEDPTAVQPPENLPGQRNRCKTDRHCAFAERCFRQIEGFGEYGFPESHAASFALLVYASCWLKCHQPAAFLAGLLNAQPMGFYSIATIIEDAKRHGVTILPIDVCASQWPCTLERAAEHTWAVRMGLRFVKGLGAKDGDTIPATREGGVYHSLAEFVRRTRLEAEVVSLLAEAGALASLEQREEVRRSLKSLRGAGEIVFGDPERVEVVDADAQKGAFISPILLKADPDRAEPHEVEAFGPVSTLMPYTSVEQVVDLADWGHATVPLIRFAARKR